MPYHPPELLEMESLYDILDWLVLLLLERCELSLETHENSIHYRRYNDCKLCELNHSNF